VSNSALSAMRGVLRTRLNEPTAGFWSNADLNKHLQTAYSTYYALYLRKNPRLAEQYSDVTYTSGAESVAVTVTGYTIGKIALVEDRTDIQPGVVLEECDSKMGVVAEAVGPDSSDNPTGDPAKWYYVKSSAATTGVIAVAGKLYLTPVPGSTRTIRIHFQAEAQSLAGDTYTTGLPDEYEECVICHAAVLAKVQEQVPPGVLSIFQDVLGKAEQKLRELAQGVSRGPGRIVFHDDTF